MTVPHLPMFAQPDTFYECDPESGKELFNPNDPEMQKKMHEMALALGQSVAEQMKAQNPELVAKVQKMVDERIQQAK